MDQENSFVEEINENDLKDEWFKKVLVVLITIAVLGGTYYFTGMSNKKAGIAIKTAEQTVVKPEIPKQLNSKDFKNNDMKVVNKDQNLNSQNYKQPENKSVNIIKPTNKALVTKSALLAAGKSDPFSGNIEKSKILSGLKTFLPRYIGKNSLSIPPSLRSLPNIGSLPNLNVPNSNLLPGKTPLAEIQNYPEVKGFIGNKVILSINGMSESLKENESFQDIKIVKVDPETMTVKFIQDKKVVTKNIKGLN
ncbi:MAG: hypothetical protein PHC34_07020 [Candidatus Gastranaerophilales bacterium]|nr:hypothetical protein [Candidatus Gastranaerophilales bacterium]